MLTALSIRDIVLIEKLDISLESGLTVLTGETGAGKYEFDKAELNCLGLELVDNLGQLSQMRFCSFKVFEHFMLL